MFVRINARRPSLCWSYTEKLFTSIYCIQIYTYIFAAYLKLNRVHAKVLTKLNFLLFAYLGYCVGELMCEACAFYSKFSIHLFSACGCYYLLFASEISCNRLRVCLTMLVYLLVYIKCVCAYLCCALTHIQVYISAAFNPRGSTWRTGDFWMRVAC